MKKFIIYRILGIMIITLTGCQTLNNRIENPDYNIFDSFGSNESYNPNDPFPKNGYTLQGVNYRNIVINKFNDCDGLYYIKYRTGSDNNKFIILS